MYPLRFAPLQVEKRWGGSALKNEFHKVPAPSQSDAGINTDSIGESFEVYEAGEDASSAIVNGFLAGNDLYSILETYLGDLVGDNIYDNFGNQFPLLIKYLDVEGRLSVQVHPTDEVAAERYDSLGKNEFWYVMDAAPDAVVYMGLNRDTTADEFYRKCKDGTVQEMLNAYHPQKGDCFFIKAGTVHAAEGGVVIAEVQENSDTTLRLYDWGFENDPATRREMHLDEAIDCIDYNKYNAGELFTPAKMAKGVVCDTRWFTVNVLHIDGEYATDPDNYNSFVLYMCVKGSARLCTSAGEEAMRQGETLLVPAAMDSYKVRSDGGEAILLQVSIRKIEEAPDEYLK